MKNIHLIPTDKKSRLLLEIDTKKIFIVSTYFQDHYRKHQNIYITSDEEIKEGDWFVVELFKITGESDGLHIEKCTKLDDVWCNNFDVISTRHKDNCKKIILTTNQDLINDGVQAIPDEFLEWYVNNPSCESVEVHELRFFDPDTNESGHCKWELIIPKEESKQETHICKYCNAETTQSDDECYAKPKQEQQTAVEWLAKQMLHPESHNPYIEQALKMEKEQRKQEYLKGMKDANELRIEQEKQNL